MIPIAASAALSAASSLASVFGSAMSSSGSNAASGTSGSSSSGAAAKSGNTVDQVDFMQLLVAQLQNQDPLNPLDSADFAAQLAQFSSLQQLTEINASLKNGGTSGAGGSLDAVGFLGKQVEGVSSAVTVAKGVGSTLDYTLSGSGTVHAQIVNASGKTVVTDLVVGSQDAGAHTFDLSKISNAPQLTDGAYTVKLAVVDDATGKASAVDTLGGGIVTGVDLSGDTPTLLIGSTRISLGDVRQVNEPTTGS